MNEDTIDPKWCRRWTHGRHSWRHLSEGGFDPRRYIVQPLDERAAKTFCAENHYAGASYPAALRRYGLTDREDGALVGAAVLAAPVNSAVLTSVFPTLTPYSQSQELSRFVLIDEVPANAESWMLARIFADLRAHGVRGVVSFADPLARQTASGVQVKAAHWGIIYQACGATFTGRGTPRTLVLLPDGTALNARAAQKVRSQEQGHQYVESRLVSFGACARLPNEPPAAWLSSALEAIGARRVRHPGAFRYAFRLGPRKDQEKVRLGVDSFEYPKPARDTNQVESEIILRF